MIVRRSVAAQASAAPEGDAEMRVCAVVIAHSECMSPLYLSSGRRIRACQEHRGRLGGATRPTWTRVSGCVKQRRAFTGHLAAERTLRDARRTTPGYLNWQRDSLSMREMPVRIRPPGSRTNGGPPHGGPPGTSTS